MSTTKQLENAGCKALEENKTHTNRFEIASESSNRLYVVSQSKSTGEWQCSCPGWIIKKPGKERTCKHLRSLMPILIEAASPAPKRIAEEAKEEKVTSKKSSSGNRKIQM